MKKVYIIWILFSQHFVVNTVVIIFKIKLKTTTIQTGTIKTFHFVIVRQNTTFPTIRINLKTPILVFLLLLDNQYFKDTHNETAIATTVFLERPHNF